MHAGNINKEVATKLDSSKTGNFVISLFGRSSSHHGLSRIHVRTHYWRRRIRYISGFERSQQGRVSVQPRAGQGSVGPKGLRGEIAAVTNYYLLG